MQVPGKTEYEISPRRSIRKMSAWPVMLAGKPVALLVIFKPEDRSDFSQEQRNRFLEILTPFMGSLFENFELNNEMILRIHVCRPL